MELDISLGLLKSSFLLVKYPRRVKRERERERGRERERDVLSFAKGREKESNPFRERAFFFIIYLFIVVVNFKYPVGTIKS